MFFLTQCVAEYDWGVVSQLTFCYNLWLRLGFCRLIITEIKSESTREQRTTSKAIVVFGVLVVMASSNVALLVVILVIVSITCDSGYDIP